MWFHLTNAPAHNKLLVLEMEKEQKLGWRASVLPIPAFQHCELYNYVLHVCTQYTSNSCSMAFEGVWDMYPECSFMYTRGRSPREYIQLHEGYIPIHPRKPCYSKLVL